MLHPRSWTGRLLRLWWRRHWFITGILRELYRDRVGIPEDRRLFPGFSAPPLDVNINLTRRCNLKCRMCNQHRHSQGSAGLIRWYDVSQELPLSHWLKFLDQFTFPSPRLYVTGGEPLLYPQFEEFVREVKKRRLVMHLQTNGLRLGRVADLLVNAGVEFVTVSLDGPPEVNDHIRGRMGAFRQAREGAATLVARRLHRCRPGPILIVNCVISQANLEVLDEMVPVALEMGADILQIQHTIFLTSEAVKRHNRLLSPEFAAARGFEVLPPSIPKGEYYENEIGPQDLPALRASLARVRARAAGRLKIIFFPPLPEEIVGPYYLDLDHPFPQVCDYPWRTLRIMPDGMVSPCLHVMTGNITEHSLAQVWNGTAMQGFRKVVAQGLFPGCARCCNRKFI